MAKHNGGCHCGKVKFTAKDPIISVACNCQRCRKLSGSLHLGVIFSEENFSVDGELSSYEYIGGSGNRVHSKFCGTCGSKIYSKAELFEGLVSVKLGVLDDALDFPPQIEVFTNYKLNWLKDNGCIKESFEEAAVAERLTSILENL